MMGERIVTWVDSVEVERWRDVRYKQRMKSSERS
jgi:hypothetical protein